MFLENTLVQYIEGCHNNAMKCAIDLKALDRLQMMWPSVLEVLENVSKDANDGDKKTQASGFIERMESFEFVFVLHIMIKILGRTQELLQCLQRKNQKIVRVVGLIGAMLIRI